MLNTCGRCGGRQVTETSIDEDFERWTGLRCLNCGDRVDQVIARHRALPIPPEPGRYIPLEQYTRLPPMREEELADAS